MGITEATMATLTTATTARDLLMLSLLLLLTPRLKLTPGMDTTVDMVSDTMVDTTVDIMATPTTDTMARGLLMPRLIPGMDTTVDTTTVATHTTAMVTAMATTGASKKGVIKCRADGHEVPTVFDDDLPNVLNFREESKRTKQNILLLQTHCI